MPFSIETYFVKVRFVKLKVRFVKVRFVKLKVSLRFVKVRFVKLKVLQLYCNSIVYTTNSLFKL